MSFLSSKTFDRQLAGRSLGRGLYSFENYLRHKISWNPYWQANSIDLFGIVAAILFCMQKYAGQGCHGEIPLENMQNICNFTQRMLSPKSIF